MLIVERKIEATNAAMTIINAHPYVISPKHFWNYLQFRYITAVSTKQFIRNRGSGSNGVMQSSRR
jgi:hypothetical protein